jgi:hypothetical protein
MCDAVTANEILFVFKLPAGDLLQVEDIIEFDAQVLEIPQMALHVQSGQKFPITLRRGDIHDLRLPGGHGTSRFPSPERLQGMS